MMMLPLTLMPIRRGVGFREGGKGGRSMKGRPKGNDDASPNPDAH